MAYLNPLPAFFRSSHTPECIQDCLPLVLSARYCDLKLALQPPAPDADARLEYRRCLCDNPYMQPLTTGQQCAFLCGHANRAAIINFVKSTDTCGSFEPWIHIAAQIPGPETFAPNYTPAEQWWRKWRDGERFGIIFGCAIAFLIVAFFVWEGVIRLVRKRPAAAS